MARTVGFFTDTTLCIGCKACEVACKEWNQLPGHAPRFGDGYDNTGQLDEQNWRHVQFHERATAKGGVAWNMMSDVCKHCALASCMEVCPTNAIIRTEFDTVYIQPDVLQRLPRLHRRLPVPRHRLRRDDRPGAQVHVLLRPAAGQPDAGVRQGLPDRVDQVRRAEHDARRRGRPAEPAPRPGDDGGAPLRRQGVRRAARPVPAHRQARGVRAAERGERGAAEPQQRCAATWARWPRRCWASWARWSRCATRRRKGVAPCLSTSSRRRSGSGTSSGTSSWAGWPEARTCSASILRLLGDRRDAGVARLAFLVALPGPGHLPHLADARSRTAPALLAHADRQPDAGLNLKYWSPMSVGAWVLMIFSAFALVSFLEAVLGEERFRLLRGAASAGVFWSSAPSSACSWPATPACCSAVSNQPIWSDTWALGGLFLASGLSVAAAALALLARSVGDGADHRGQARPSGPVLHRARARAARRSSSSAWARWAPASSSRAGSSCGRWCWWARWCRWSFRGPPRARARRCSPAAWCCSGGLALRIVVIFGAQM